MALSGQEANKSCPIKRKETQENKPVPEKYFK